MRSQREERLLLSSVHQGRGSKPLELLEDRKAERDTRAHTRVSVRTGRGQAATVDLEH